MTVPVFELPDLTPDYENAGHIPHGDAYPTRWAERAAAFREAMGPRAVLGAHYGDGYRQWADLYYPEGSPRGVAVIVHGGYWMRFGPRDWSHLAAGAVEAGWLAVVPGYTLSPNGTVRSIVHEVARCVDLVAGANPGPVRLAGHSAGGQVVARLACTDTPLAPRTVARLERVVSISGLADLRPLLRTDLNHTLDLSEADARAQSPALLDPLAHIDLVAWVGANERPEFVRQNRLIATAWERLVRSVRCVEEPGRHHFDVVEGLEDAAAPLARALVG